MIIACPACATRYVVPDSAVGIDGRTVRCAKCRHSWFQDGHQLERPEQAAPPPVDAATLPVEQQEAVPGHEVKVPQPTEEVPSTDQSGPNEPFPDDQTADSAEEEVEEYPGAPAAPVDAVEIPSPMMSAPASMQEPEAQYSQFEYQPPFRSRRNPLRIWTAAAAVFAVIALGTIAAVNFWGAPDWIPFNRPTFAASQPDLVLDFPPAQQDRRTLPNGSEFFGAVGTITNVGRESRKVPSILIVMRDEREKIVYSWVLAPPKPALAPGEKMTVVEAVTDVPKSAKFVEIGWKPS